LHKKGARVVLISPLEAFLAFVVISALALPEVYSWLGKKTNIKKLPLLACTFGSALVILPLGVVVGFTVLSGKISGGVQALLDPVVLVAFGICEASLLIAALAALIIGKRSQ
jgi:hypothetical protein